MLSGIKDNCKFTRNENNTPARKMRIFYILLQFASQSIRKSVAFMTNKIPKN